MAIFGKGDQSRVNETLQMIQNAPDLTPVIRQQIVTLVNNRFPRLTQQNRQTYHQLSSELSVKDNIAPGVPRGSEAQREMRRAICLLWMTIGHEQGINLMAAIRQRAQQGMTLQPNALGAAFSDVMLKAGVVAANVGGQYVFQELETHPARFLNQYRIIVLGLTTGGDRLSTAPNGNYQNVLNFHFQYDGADDRFALAGTANGTQHYGADYAFPTASIPAVHWSNVPGVGAAPGNFNGVLGCELTGATFALTTQFTGCAFSWTDHGGTIRASHISPAGGGPTSYPGGGNALARRLMLPAHGKMANAGNTALTVFGAGAGNAPAVRGGNPFYPDRLVNSFKWASIVGMDKGGNGWRFYLQVIGDPNNIQEARRIM